MNDMHSEKSTRVSRQGATYLWTILAISLVVLGYTTELPYDRTIWYIVIGGVCGTVWHLFAYATTVVSYSRDTSPTWTEALMYGGGIGVLAAVVLDIFPEAVGMGVAIGFAVVYAAGLWVVNVQYKKSD